MTARRNVAFLKSKMPRMVLIRTPILMVPEIGGTQASGINSLSEAPPLAYFVHNTYLDPSVFGTVWFKCKRSKWR